MCVDDEACKVDSKEPLDLPSERGRPYLTLVLRDSARRQSLASSRFDFRTSRKLGEVLSFAPERVNCVLESGRLVPHFAVSDPKQVLMEQLR